MGKASKQGNKIVCEPPPQPQQDDEMCEGQFTGTIRLEKCCCKLVSQTSIISIGPMTEADLVALLQQTVTDAEAQGYIVLAHSLVDAGAGWILGLTLAWYV